MLRLAGALEHASEHPIARAVAAGAERGPQARAAGRCRTPEDFANVAGLGVRGVVDGHAVLVGPRAAAEPSGRRSLPPELAAAKAAAEAAGRTAVAVGWDGAARARARRRRRGQADQRRGGAPAARRSG